MGVGWAIHAEAVFLLENCVKVLFAFFIAQTWSFNFFWMFECIEFLSKVLWSRRNIIFTNECIWVINNLTLFWWLGPFLHAFIIPVINLLNFTTRVVKNVVRISLVDLFLRNVFGSSINDGHWLLSFIRFCFLKNYAKIFSVFLQGVFVVM